MFFAKRCDPQSACAKRSLELLDVLQTRALSLSVIDTSTLTFLVWGISFSQTQDYWSMVPSDVRTLLWNQTLDDEGQHLLTRHLCPTLALEIVREAQHHASKHSSTMDNDDRVQQQAWLLILKTLLAALHATPTPRIKLILEWYIPQQMGHGIASLAALHAQSNSKGHSSNAYLRLFQSS